MVAETKALQVKGPQELEDLRGQTHRLDEIFRHLMQRDTDYGVIPGTQKPTLLKPGAELLRLWAGLEVTFQVDATGTDRILGVYHFLVTATATHDGARVAEGVGYGTTLEAKHHYRWVWPSDLPPEVDKATAVTRTVRTAKGPVKQYRIENENPHDQANTVLKMAKKRAFVDAMLTATGASRIFTQDVEDDDRQTIRAADEAEDISTQRQSTPAPTPSPSQPTPAVAPVSKKPTPLMPSEGIVAEAELFGDAPEGETPANLIPVGEVGLRAILRAALENRWPGSSANQAAFLRHYYQITDVAKVPADKLQEAIAKLKPPERPQAKKEA